jgi:uncharacterized protein (DUF849 family)
VVLQAALNGARSKADHSAVPVSIDELVADATGCVAAGAALLHLHPRDVDGRETLAPDVVDAVVERVRAAAGVPVSVSTGAWIEPDPRRRAALVSRWRAPDLASVNLSEEGYEAVMRALVDAGVGIEAGVWSVHDAERLAASGLGDRVTRILIELIDVPTGEALAAAGEIHAVLDRTGLTSARRLQHGEGEPTWPMLEDAVERGIDTRIGLEDTLQDPDGATTSGNVALVRAARRLAAPGSRSAGG